MEHRTDRRRLAQHFLTSRSSEFTVLKAHSVMGAWIQEESHFHLTRCGSRWKKARSENHPVPLILQYELAGVSHTNGRI